MCPQSIRQSNRHNRASTTPSARIHEANADDLIHHPSLIGHCVALAFSIFTSLRSRTVFTKQVHTYNVGQTKEQGTQCRLIKEVPMLNDALSPSRICMENYYAVGTLITILIQVVMRLLLLREVERGGSVTAGTSGGRGEGEGEGEEWILKESKECSNPHEDFLCVWIDNGQPPTRSPRQRNDLTPTTVAKCNVGPKAEKSRTAWGAGGWVGR